MQYFKKRKLLYTPLLFVCLLTVNTAKAISDTPENSMTISDIALEGNKIIMNADDKDLYPELEAIINKSRAAQNLDIDMDFLKKGMEQLNPVSSLNSEVVEIEEKIYVFASRGQPETELVDLFEEASSDKRTTVVFRGIYPNESLNEGLRDIHRILKKATTESVPNIIIDPTLFTQFNINSSPVLVLSKGKELLAKANGTYAIEWINREYKVNNREGFLGTFGTTVPVAEPDMIETMKQRMASINFKEKKEKIINSYWDKYSYTELRSAKEDSKRKLDPSFTISSPINDHLGNPILNKGEKINPLDLMPFISRLIIFNAQNNNEVNYVDKYIHSQPDTVNIVVITTRLDPQNGWDQKAEIEARFQRPIYLLTPDIKQRFGLRATPSIVNADDKYFYISEIDVNSQNITARKNK
jgi:conjugal transfer pilus assembly protein TraW